MQKADLNKYGTALRTKRAELVAALPSVAALHNQAALGESGGDELDEVQRSMERDLTVRSVDRDTSLLREIRAAVTRLETNSYGICVRCDEEISPKRLQAMPWAAHCLACQDALDRGEGKNLTEEEQNDEIAWEGAVMAAATHGIMQHNRRRNVSGGVVKRRRTA